MKQEFAIFPWEYRGSGYGTEPHAVSSLNIGGQQRDFLLKMREGIIYFKEPKRTLVFAVLRQFDWDMRDDELVQAWRREMEQENFGRVLWRPIGFADTPANTVIVSLVRANFSGWFSDAFNIHWFDMTKSTGGGLLDLWARNVSHTNHALYPTIESMRSSLLDRSMASRERQAVAERWVVGEEDELRRIFAVGMQLYARTRDCTSHLRYWPFAATNPASEGGFVDSFRPSRERNVTFSAALADFLRLLGQHFVLVGMEWKHFNHMPYHTSPLRPMIAQWGDEWRGNYQLYTPTIQFPVPLVSSLTGHERLELQLELRDWLESKVSRPQSANLLAKALD